MVAGTWALTKEDTEMKITASQRMWAKRSGVLCGSLHVKSSDLQIDGSRAVYTFGLYALNPDALNLDI
jgi:hypothetical protein